MSLHYTESRLFIAIGAKMTLMIPGFLWMSEGMRKYYGRRVMHQTSILWGSGLVKLARSIILAGVQAGRLWE